MAHVEAGAERMHAVVAGDVLVDQHQQARLLDGAAQHELHVGGAQAAGAGPHGLLAPIGVHQVGGDVQVEAVGQTGPRGFFKQRRHLLEQVRLEGHRQAWVWVATRGAVGDPAEQAVEVHRGRQGVVEHGQAQLALQLRAVQVWQHLGQPGPQPGAEPLGQGLEEGQFGRSHPRRGHAAVAVLQLHAAGRQPRQVEPLAAGVGLAGQGLLHQAVHPPVAGVFAVGEHAEAAVQVAGVAHIAGVEPALEGVAHQLHAHTVEVLHQQQVAGVAAVAAQVGQQLGGAAGVGPQGAGAGGGGWTGGGGHPGGRGWPHPDRGRLTRSVVADTLCTDLPDPWPTAPCRSSARSPCGPW